MTAIGTEQLATHITDLQTKLRIEQTEQGRIALVGCETEFWQYNCCLGVFWLGHLWHF
jgi:hypothetical protein